MSVGDSRPLHHANSCSSRRQKLFRQDDEAIHKIYDKSQVNTGPALPYSNAVQLQIYHHQHQQQQQQRMMTAVSPQQLHHVQISSGRAIEGADIGYEDELSLADVNIRFHRVSSQQELKSRKEAIIKELEIRKDNPPMIPPPTIGDMEPNPVFPDFLDINQETPKSAIPSIQARNNRLAAAMQKVDRERNNEAAKRSRRVKSEALENAKLIIHDLAAEVEWLSVALIAHGGHPEAYRLLSPAVKHVLHGEVHKRIEDKMLARKEAQRAEDSRKRVQRQRERARQKQLANERQARMRAQEHVVAAAAVTPEEASAGQQELLMNEGFDLHLPEEVENTAEEE